MTGPVHSPVNTLTSRSPPSGTASATGSDHTWPPAGTTTGDEPPKVSARTVPATAAAVPGTPRATVTDASRSGPVPRALVSRTRTARPPTLARTAHRTVRPAYPGSVPDADAAQVPTHPARPPDGLIPAGPRNRPATAAAGPGAATPPAN